ncbi:hypothetical protein MN116_006242 [Schistosoma mekongi]|uniref:FERM domain-containing protein n=1 Tax=Schistosoma mekongi TaxID=38744 RepID=A0AAE1ZBH0_SCHME|nr:hypothetical protein MN116_006242 [Schistosoma mekongi]
MRSLKKNRAKSSPTKKKTNDYANGVSEKCLKPGDLFQCKVRLLDDSQLPVEFSMKKSDIGSLLFQRVCQSVGDLVECDYFGLRYTDKENIRQWLELDKSVYKQLKDCKSFVVNFRVKHYPPDPVHDLAQNLSRYLMYLQIRRDLTQGRLLCPAFLVGKLGALVAQAEIGDAPTENVELSSSEVVCCAPPSLYDTRLDSVESTESANMSTTNNCDQSIHEETLDYAACCNMLRKLKIVFNQTPEVEAQIMKEYQKLRGLKAVEAETELLQRASQLPTYGIDPVPATPMQKIYLPISTGATGNSSPSTNVKENKGDRNSVTLSAQPVNLPEGATFYLGITSTGVVTFVGRQRNAEYTWDQIHRLGCDGKLFLIYLKRDHAVTGKKLFRTKYILHSFHCKSKTAALAFWHWVNDRKYFFTLKKASEAKKIKPSTNIFSRGHTYRFSGRSQQELRACTGSITNLPQQSFSRVSSFRKVYGLQPNSELNGRATLPGRLRPSDDSNGNRSERPRTLDEISPLMAAFADMPDKRIPDTVIEQPCEEDLDESAKASQNSKDKKMNDVDVGKDGVIQATVESWIEPTQIVQQAVSVEKLGVQSLSSDKCSESNMLVRKRTEHPILTSADYTQAVNALDKTLDHHINLTQPSAVTKSKVETYMNMPNGETIRMPSNDEYKVCANGPCTKKFNYESTHVNGDASSANIRSHIVKHQDEQSSSVKRYIIALTATAFVVLAGIIVILETTPDKSNRYHQNIFYNTIRHNPFIERFQEYVYTPVKRSVVDGFAFLLSFIDS